MKGKKILIIVGFFNIISVIFIGGRVPYFLFYSYLLVLLISFFHVYIGKIKISGEMKLPSSDFVAGEEIVISYIIKNNSSKFFPLLELKSNIGNLLSGREEKIKVFHLDKNEKYTVQTNIVCNRRGHYKTGDANLIIKDIFNIFSVTKKIHEPISLKIYPRIISINNFETLGNLQMGDLIVKNPIFQDYSSLADLRVYQDGDSVKRINWKISAKLDQLIVKLFELKGDTEIVILINNEIKSYYYDNNRKIEDTAVEVAVSIIEFCLEKNIDVSLASEDGYYDGKIKGNSKIYFKLFLDELVEFSPLKEKTFINSITNASISLKQGSTLMVITPRISNDIGIAITNLKIKNINPIVIVIDTENINSFSDDNKIVSRKLKQENISLYFINTKEHFGHILEVDDEKATQ